MGLRTVLCILLFMKVNFSLTDDIVSNPSLDNHKPRFTSCSSYKPEVKEEQPKNTTVFQVKADDEDPPENGGTVTYKIIKREGERVYFRIDNKTGIIYTTVEIDRDEPSRMKQLYLTVEATDNGRPPLSDLCTIKVSVTDINDNFPVFDSADYNSRVSVDKRVNSEVLRVLAYDTDDGENARLTYSFKDKSHQQFLNYFSIDADTGVIRLKTKFDKSDKDKQFQNEIVVKDNGPNGGHEVKVPITITVVSSDKQAPSIKTIEPAYSITLPENYNDYTKPLFTIVAESKIDDNEVVFELQQGKTEQTNSLHSFILSTDNSNTAQITLGRPLDYETVTEYTLTIRVKNKDQMDTAVNVHINVTDVNDEIPNFIEVIKGSVVENDRPGQQAMRIQAIDKDGTAPNNVVTYELLDKGDQMTTELFEIDPQTGVITSKVSFDREAVSVYHVTVKASDSAKSALKQNGEPNFVEQTFQIIIEDTNDNKPYFTQSIYHFDQIAESSDIDKIVGEVAAKDNDTAALIEYSIIEGNEDGDFRIVDTTGHIKINKRLNFEEKENYSLTVKASDGTYEDTAKVFISILNENDERPIFEPYDRNINLKEEEPFDGCITNLKAYDPDIKDRSVDQKIKYVIPKEKSDAFGVDSDGCVRLLKPLDRDKPNGSPTQQLFVFAYDNNGVGTTLNSYAELIINLEDINDNAPFLNVTEFVYYENQDTNKLVGVLTADDYDSPENGPPFTYEIDSSAPDIIKTKFYISENALFASATFDREEQKYYHIPVKVTDNGNPKQEGVSDLLIIIGDVNDNPASDGQSEIFVYKYEKSNIDLNIGRVFVEDPDDWDLPDKYFVQVDNNVDFKVLPNGTIIMSSTVAPGEYTIECDVTEEHLPLIPRHQVKGVVHVTVKEIIEEAVIKSGSVRLNGSTIEDFIEHSDDGISKKDALRNYIAKQLNTSETNVDVFTVMKSNDSLVDVRFSAHGSPYYYPEKLNNLVTEHQDILERNLGVDFVMVNINECLNENACVNSSCTNVLSIKEEPAMVSTNRSSFVGVKAVVERVCDCLNKEVVECFNGGIPIENGQCSCPPGFEGPRCEILGIGFKGTGWAMYPTLESCRDWELILFVKSENQNGLIFYVGPLVPKHAAISKDFISLELVDGFPLLKINVGYNTNEIKVDRKITDGAVHKLRIVFERMTDLQIYVDDCNSNCLKWVTLDHPGILNVNGPLQMGGVKYKFHEEETKSIWNVGPGTNNAFFGCIMNFTYNGFHYHLGAPGDSYQAFSDCNYVMYQAAVFGVDSKFLVALLICIGVLIILLLAFVVHRRRQDNIANEKDFDDTRENIINYEDEGGGEYDANYDLSVLRPNLDEKPRFNDDVPADISDFLDSKKHSCDKDPVNLPCDDVRHYAYEGDGNTSGSLSSLASCTDDGDLHLDFNSFGPRFRKLADMYGEEQSDDESQNGNEEWC